MGKPTTMGLSEIEPPRSYARHEFSEDRLLAIANQLKGGKWLTEQRSDLILSYGQARYRAQALIVALSRAGMDVSRVEYRTWTDTDGRTRWAIRKREK